MNRFVHGFSLIAVLFMLMVSVLFPTNSIMWLATGSIFYNALRVILAIGLLVLFVTDPPRHHKFRVVLGIAAVVLLGWTMYSTYNNHMQLFDTLIFANVGVVFGIAGLELDPDEQLTSKLRASHSAQI
jgi:hypothetical protein